MSGDGGLALDDPDGLATSDVDGLVQDGIDSRFAGERPLARLGEIAPGVSVMIALSYGAVWVFFALFFRRFSMTPEQAGIGPEFISIRAAVMLAVMFGMFGTLLVPLLWDWLRRGRRGDLRPFHAGFAVSCFWLFVVSLVLCWLALDSAGDYFGFDLSTCARFAIAIAIGLAATLVVGSQVLAGVSYQASNASGPGLGARLRPGPLVGAASVWATVLFLGMGAAGSMAAERVANGDASGIYSLVLGVRPATVRKVGSDNVPGQSLCNLVYLGSNEGTAYFYSDDSNQTLGVSTELVELTLGRFPTTLGTSDTPRLPCPGVDDG